MPNYSLKIKYIKTKSYIFIWKSFDLHTGRVKRIWFLSPMRAAKVQASLRIRAVSPEPPLLAHTSCVSRGIFRQKTKSLAPLNSWACAVKICHDRMLEDTNSLDGAHTVLIWRPQFCVKTHTHIQWLFEISFMYVCIPLNIKTFSFLKTE